MPRSRFLLLYALAWLPLVLVYGAVLYATAGGAMGPAEVALSALFSIAPPALLGLAVWWATARIGAMPGITRAVLAHVGLGVLFTTIWAAVITAQIALFAPADTLDRYLRNAMPWQLLMGVFVYGLVAGVAAAVRATRRMREREAAATRAEALRARAELGALRARLDPHFLFNTLHSITALVRLDPQAAEDALERMAGLLRYVLDAGRGEGEDVALADELDFARAYLALEQLRLGDRLRVEERIDPDALDCALPALSLQPLVENAIRHGLAPLARGGTLRLHAGLVEQPDGTPRLQLEVTDDGAGADAAAVSHATGVGLGAVRQRLHARFGAQAASAEVRTAPGEGFTVRLTLPAVVAPPARRAVPSLAPSTSTVPA